MKSADGTLKVDRSCIPSKIFLLAALLIGASYWIGVRVIRPAATLDQAILFRPGGDPDYLPPLTALARLDFGEASVREMAGQGIRSFPFGSLLLHSSLVRLFGEPGFVAADIFAFLLYGCVLSYFLRKSGIARPIAEVLTLFVLSGALSVVLHSIFGTYTNNIPVTFWHHRFPRPLITESFVVAFLSLAVRFINDPELRSKLSAWALMGALGACLVQSDIYQAMNITLLAIFLVLYLFPKNRKTILGGVTVAVGVAAILSTPFVYQRLHESQDILRRWGTFSSGHRLVLPGFGLISFAFLILLLEILLCYRFRDSMEGSTRAGALIIGVVLIASVLSCTLSLFVLGRGLQIYHFRQETELVSGYAVLLCTGIVLQASFQWLGRTLRIREIPALRLKALAFAAAVVVAVAAAAMEAREVIRQELPAQGTLKMAGVPLQRYKSSFADLRAELMRPQYKNAQVIGTLDLQLADWWQYRNRYIYLPDTFNSTASDSEVEARVYCFLRMMGTSPEDFDRLLDSDYFLLRVLSGAKYQANAKYAPWPIEEYSPDARRRIAGTSVWERLHLELPTSERRRLLHAYAQFYPPAEPYRKLDIIVLLKGKLRQFFHPEKGSLTLAWENDAFELWIPRNDSAVLRP
jgi:hypothetical protein